MMIPLLCFSLLFLFLQDETSRVHCALNYIVATFREALLSYRESMCYGTTHFLKRVISIHHLDLPALCLFLTSVATLA